MMMEKGKKRQRRSSERRFENLHGPVSRHVSPRNVRGQHRLPLLEQDGQNTPDGRPSHVGFKQSGQEGEGGREEGDQGRGYTEVIGQWHFPHQGETEDRGGRRAA